VNCGNGFFPTFLSKFEFLNWRHYKHHPSSVIGRYGLEKKCILLNSEIAARIDSNLDLVGLKLSTAAPSRGREIRPQLSSEFDGQILIGFSGQVQEIALAVERSRSQLQTQTFKQFVHAVIIVEFFVVVEE
jgi:hypothetical protein